MVAMANLLAGQYELTGAIGQGPTGAVWRAREVSTRQNLAIKVLEPHLSSDPAIVDRFVRERPVLMAFLHPAYVRVRDLVATDGVVALVMEFVTGWDLRRHLDNSGPFSPSMAAEIATTVAEALAAAHDAGVVHCDVKPSNLLLAEPSGEVRLTDCRVARLARGYQGPAAWYATPEYAAPEVIRGGPPEAATDVYALGLVLCEMLTGVTPFRGTDIDEVLAGRDRPEPVLPASVPFRLARVVADCLRDEPAARPTAAEVATRLRNAQDWLYLERESRAEPSPPPPPPSVSVHSEPDLWDTGWVEHDQSADPVRPPENPPPTPARPLGRARPSTLVRLAAVAGGVMVLVAAIVTVRALSPTADNTGAGTNAGNTVDGSSPRVGGTNPVTSRPSAPVAPPSAAPETLDGATVFVHFWLETLSYAVATGDAAALEAVSSRECKACADAAALIRNAYRDGSTLHGGAYSVRDVSADDFQIGARPNLRVVFDRTPRSTVGADGRQRDAVPGGTFLTCQVLLERADGRWRVRAVLSPVGIV